MSSCTGILSVKGHSQRSFNPLTCHLNGGGREEAFPPPPPLQGRVRDVEDSCKNIECESTLEYGFGEEFRTIVLSTNTEK
ncbi:hypothetical protein NPIL_85041 [Nephila pilipes]|uniref:Uncharacterized protein n=1 Tax=Nephila pilipes TaxID=299642 RepID=A0A8X6Q0T3_NEPPI|nr:hypothetical protein NPIL_85041 [Nephila pilipes]